MRVYVEVALRSLGGFAEFDFSVQACDAPQDNRSPVLAIIIFSVLCETLNPGQTSNRIAPRAPCAHIDNLPAAVCCSKSETERRSVPRRIRTEPGGAGPVEKLVDQTAALLDAPASIFSPDAWRLDVSRACRNQAATQTASGKWALLRECT